MKRLIERFGVVLMVAAVASLAGWLDRGTWTNAALNALFTLGAFIWIVAGLFDDKKVNE